MLRRCFTTTTFRLKHPLGPWLSPSLSTQTWQTLIDPDDSLIYRRFQDTWQVLRPGRTRSSYTVYTTTTTLPPLTLPITLTHRGSTFRPSPYARREETIIFSPPPPPSFATYLTTLPPHEQWIVGHVPPLTRPDQDAIFNAILTGSFCLGSDGSNKNHSTSYASRIQHLYQHNIFLSSHSKAPHTSTLRAEAYGYLGSLYLLRAVTSYLLHTHQTLRPSSISQYTDSKGLIQRLAQNHTRSLRYHLLTHSDIIREIREVERSLPFTFVRHHIRSHQHDDVEDATTLPIPHFLNRACDAACTTAHTCSKCSPPKNPPSFPSTYAYLRFSSHNLSHHLDTTHKHYCQDISLKHHLLTREGWSSTILHLIYWDGIKSAMQRSTQNQRRSAIKLMHRLWATNSEMNKRDNSHDSRCSRCSTLREDFYHIFRCPSSETLHYSSQHSLRQFLKARHVAPLMSTVLIHGIHTWLTNSSDTFPFHLHPQDSFLVQLRQAYDDQALIGWHNLLRGRLASSWLKTHDIYLQSRQLHPRYASTRLAPYLVLHLWDLSRSYWKKRNEDIHGATRQESQKTQQERLFAKIREAYSTQEDFTATDREILFTTSLDQRLKMSLASLVHWYALYQACLNAPPEPTDTPPPSQAPLHNFFRQFRRAYFPTVHTAQTTTNAIDTNLTQQPANDTP